MGYYSDDSEIDVQETLYDRMGTGSALTKFMENGEVKIFKGPNKIKDSIYDILITPYGTRFFLPTYGCRVHECLMEPNDFLARDLAKMYVREALEAWEPRITIIDIVPVSGISVMEITITYRINSLGMTDSYVFTMEKRVPELL